MKYNRANTIKEYMACGGILDVLKAVQAGEGYISEEAIEDIAKAYGKYPSEVYETATFYTMLSVGHKADHMVEVCGSTCCDAGDAKSVMDAIAKELGIGLGEVTEDKKWFFRRCECLGRCDTAPNVVIDGNLITNATAEQVVECIRKAGK
ncbi:MAG: NAD(P)H-dependent oxidoreductase subunit E [Mogibacterium sp.]|nr:NAD(P)H-dependent oxidoreductase subunit E [Mogibacterium sp.]MBP3896847.1 NAD(P)H-dependent oxidoreductase subunit E [Mogibacterium sp.]